MGFTNHFVPPIFVVLLCTAFIRGKHTWKLSRSISPSPHGCASPSNTLKSGSRGWPPEVSTACSKGRRWPCEGNISPAWGPVHGAVCGWCVELATLPLGFIYTTFKREPKPSTCCTKQCKPQAVLNWGFPVLQEKRDPARAITRGT